MRHITDDYLYMYTLVPITGLVTGAMQYAILRRYFAHMAWWVVTTSAGWVVGACLAFLLEWTNWTDPGIATRLAYLTLGITIGIAQ